MLDRLPKLVIRKIYLPHHFKKCQTYYTWAILCYMSIHCNKTDKVCCSVQEYSNLNKLFYDQERKRSCFFGVSHVSFNHHEFNITMILVPFTYNLMHELNSKFFLISADTSNILCQISRVRCPKVLCTLFFHAYLFSFMRTHKSTLSSPYEHHDASL